jgi:hypothetical protein
LAGPIGIIVGIGVAGAVALAANWDKFGDKLDAVKEIQARVGTEMVREQAEMTKLITIINDSTRSYKDRESALKSAQAISNVYFGSLSLEKSGIEQVTAAYDAYIVNLRKATEIRLISQEQTKLIEENIKLTDQLSRAQATSTIASIATKVGYYGIANAAEQYSRSSISDTVADNEKKINSLNERLKALQSTFVDDTANKNVKVNVSKTTKIKNEEQFSRIDETAAINSKGVSIPFTVIPLSDKDLQNRIVIPTTRSLEDSFGKEFSKISDRLQISFKTTAQIEAEINEAKLQEARNKMASVAQQAASIANQGIAAIGDIVNNSITKRANAIDDLYARERKGIENSLIPASVKEKRLQALEEQTAAKRRKIAREQAVANKKAALFSAIVNGAAGVLKGLADAGLAGAIAAGAIATLQIAAIASAPIPALVKGGVLTKDTVVRVGEYPGAQSNPEIVTPQNLLTSIVRKELKNANREGFSTARTQSGGVLESTTDISSDALRLLHRFQEYKSTRVRVV